VAIRRLTLSYILNENLTSAATINSLGVVEMLFQFGYGHKYPNNSPRSCSCKTRCLRWDIKDGRGLSQSNLGVWLFVPKWWSLAESEGSKAANAILSQRNQGECCCVCNPRPQAARKPAHNFNIALTRKGGSDAMVSSSAQTRPANLTSLESKSASTYGESTEDGCNVPANGCGARYWDTKTVSQLSLFFVSEK
jgi:hypothetical protein